MPYRLAIALHSFACVFYFLSLATNVIILQCSQKINLNGEHNIVTIIEKDPVDNPIELIKVKKTTTHKFIIIAGIATLSALGLYTIKKKRNTK